MGTYFKITPASGTSGTSITLTIQNKGLHNRVNQEETLVVTSNGKSAQATLVALGMPHCLCLEERYPSANPPQGVVPLFPTDGVVTTPLNADGGLYMLSYQLNLDAIAYRSNDESVVTSESLSYVTFQLAYFNPTLPVFQDVTPITIGSAGAYLAAPTGYGDAGHYFVGLAFQIAANPLATTRDIYIQISNPAYDPSSRSVIKVTQAAGTAVTLSADSVSVIDGDSSDISLASSDGWTASVTE